MDKTQHVKASLLTELKRHPIDALDLALVFMDLFQKHESKQVSDAEVET